MTLTQLLAELYRRTGYASTPASEITTRFTSFVNLAHRQILTKPGLGRLRDDTITFASVADQAVYALPMAVAKIDHLQDRSNNRALPEQPLTWLRQGDPGLTSSGLPVVYVPRGSQQVQVQPSAASTLYVVSTNAGDVGTAYLEGFRTGGYPFSTSVTMTGATSAAFPVTDIIEVTKFYLSTAALGTVTLKDSA